MMNQYQICKNFLQMNTVSLTGTTMALLRTTGLNFGLKIQGDRVLILPLPVHDREFDLLLLPSGK